MPPSCTTLDGLHYRRMYNRTLSYIGLPRMDALRIPIRDQAIDRPTSIYVHGLLGDVSTTSAAALWVVFYTQNSPWSYYLHVSFPAYFWSQIL
ncbi:hypothetical protein P691DRAFT_297216 [Macrolepiota fuliginosa MF-IS2]|uniref:GPI ethanolamine phosphate transferase 1 C-terminal domain-containing protein n=1 Tax=Macrolepiota fuliginosa MF-IS2 TaxID=1400762 RepID=A0A9P5X540_9AGAR|nr:hypothetical protein P691DRAFT_297216 [Macrolepiota fuliginosa MF-IS2]